MNNSKLPTSFQDLRSSIYLKRNRNEKKILIRFAYRYRLARSLERTIAPHVGRTLKGYDAIHKVFLTYTAYEQIIKAANRLEIFQIYPIEINKVEDLELANRIREKEKLMKFLSLQDNDTNLSLKLKEFIKGDSNDLSCVAYAIRNFYAHGELTPTAIGLSKEDHYDLMWDFSIFILNYCDDVFTKCVQKLR